MEAPYKRFALWAKPWRRADSLRPSEMNRGPRTAQLCGAAAKMLEFELAATLRDQIIQLRGEKK